MKQPSAEITLAQAEAVVAAHNAVKYQVWIEEQRGRVGRFYRLRAHDDSIGHVFSPVTVYLAVTAASDAGTLSGWSFFERDGEIRIRKSDEILWNVPPREEISADEFWSRAATLRDDIRRRLSRPAEIIEQYTGR